MPSIHRRIGLVADPPVDAALAVYRDGRSGQISPAATAARAAVLQGAVLETIESEAQSGGVNSKKAAEVLTLMNELLPNLDMPEPLLEHFSRRFSRVVESVKERDRTAGLLALMRSPQPHDEMSLLIAEDFDELDRLGP